MSGGQGEDTGTVPQIDEGAGLIETEFTQPRKVAAVQSPLTQANSPRGDREHAESGGRFA